LKTGEMAGSSSTAEVATTGSAAATRGWKLYLRIAVGTCEMVNRNN
jgi:hypothetical protein